LESQSGGKPSWEVHPLISERKQRRQKAQTRTTNYSYDEKVKKNLKRSGSGLGGFEISYLGQERTSQTENVGDSTREYTGPPETFKYRTRALQTGPARVHKIGGIFSGKRKVELDRGTQPLRNH